MDCAANPSFAHFLRMSQGFSRVCRGSVWHAACSGVGMAQPVLVAEYMSPLSLTVGADQPMNVAHRFMREHRCRYLPVLAGGKIVGIVSDGDLHLIETLKGVDPEHVLVEEAMSTDPYCAESNTPLADVVQVMAERKYGCSVVTDGGRVSGILTTVDVCRAFADFLRTAT
jgi:acetoin utilization protein AcuB